MSDKVTVKFLIKKGFCKPGDIQSFPAAQAKDLIEKGFAQEVKMVAADELETTKPFRFSKKVSEKGDE